MYSKWEKAARDAEETLGLSRVERLDCFLVTYGSLPSAKVPAKVTPKAARPTKPPASKPTQKKGTMSTGAGFGFGGAPLNRRPGPASQTGLARSPTRATGGQFPAGWRIRDRTDGVQTFISPDGREFQVSVPVCSQCDVCWPGQVVSPALRLQHSGQSQPCPAPGGLHPAAGLEMSENTKQHLLLLSQGRAVSETAWDYLCKQLVCLRFDTRDGIACSLEQDGVSPDIIARLRRGGRK